MCRFTFYLGESIPLSSLLTEPTHSLIRQSFDARERSEPLNGDGFGVAWYIQRDQESAVFRSITPAWNNTNLLDLARVTTSHCILAHVRDATQGLGVSESNCHPFKSRELTFAHNGDIGGFAKVRRHLLKQLSDISFDSIKGTTDSEHFFALYQDNLGALGGSKNLDNMAAALRHTIQQVVDMVNTYSPGEICNFNMAVTDGRKSVICRFTSGDIENASSLYINEGRKYICENGVCTMRPLENSSQKSVVISSEPLSADDNWTAVRPNSLITIGEDLTTRTELI